MTAEQKSIYLVSLGRIPSYPKNEHYHWADYIELLCLANPDGEISISDVIDRLTERQDLSEDEINKELQEIQEGTNGIGIRAEVNDRIKNYVTDWFNTLRLRPGLHGKAYPFVITEKQIVFKQKKLSNEKKIYINLLLCANLYLFDKKLIIPLTSSFELLSYYALQKILPQTAEAHLFGSSNVNKLGRYGNKRSLWQKLNILAEDLFLKLHHDMDEEQYPSTNRGDGGLDLVGWIPTGDTASGTVTILAQCACSPKEWKQKQSDASSDAWDNKIIFTTRPNNVIFIPFCFRKSNGNWFSTSDIRKSFLIDRKRLIYFLKKSSSMYSELPSAKIVDEVLMLKEEVV